jgi:uncharacterized protein (DUF2336 family)
MSAQVAFAAEVGQRRRALLAHAHRPAETRRLSMADVATLRADRSPEARALVARKLGEQLEELVAGGHAPLVEALLRLLARDPAPRVRAALAEAVAASRYLPSELALALATDEIAVARPVLERSPVLAEGELCRVVRSGRPAHALAAAAREVIPDALGAALVETGDREVVLRVVRHAGAELSSAALAQVVEAWQGDDALLDQVARRAGLPLALVERLIALIEARLAREPARGAAVTTAQAVERIRASRARAMAGKGIRDHVEQAFRRRLHAHMAAEGVTPHQLVGLLRAGDLVALEVGLSVMARLDLGPCRRLLYHDDPQYGAALCARAGIPAPHYLMLRALLDRAGDGSRAPAAAADIERAGALLASYEELRGDPELVERICNG